MKRLFSVILILFMVGCGSAKSSIKPVTKGISFECDATYYNEAYECKGTVNADGMTVIEFLSPADIKGLKFTFTKSGAKANFKETEYKAQKIVFENSVASFIYGVLSADDGVVLTDNDIFYTEGIVGDFEYKLELGGTGLPLKITAKPDAVEVIFKNVKIK